MRQLRSSAVRPDIGVLDSTSRRGARARTVLLRRPSQPLVERLGIDSEQTRRLALVAAATLEGVQNVFVRHLFELDDWPIVPGAASQGTRGAHVERQIFDLHFL